MFSTRKISSSMILLVACIFGVAIGLFGLNYYHATKCANSQSTQESSEYIEALNKRLLQAESQVMRELPGIVVNIIRMHKFT